jgi:cytochrome c biogenesis protein CcdA/thiol-disulfide isomerase/thioredoxin
MTLLFISFIAGILTVLAPCILPLLPVIIGGSVAGDKNKYKSLTIISSLVISIILFTLILKWSTAFVAVSPAVWTSISGGILILVALTMLFPELWDNLPFVNRLSIGSNKVMGEGYQKKSFWGDVIIGAALGPVFSSCSPTYFVILATVLPQSFARGIADLAAYAVGLGIVLFLIAFLGQKVVDRVGGLADPKGWFKRTIGILFLIIGICIVTGLDKNVEAYLTLHGYTGVSTLEENLLQKNNAQNQPPITPATQAQTQQQQQVLADATNNKTSLATILAAKAKLYPKYHEIVDPGGFVNTNGQPITIGQYIGKKVILLDFMTYSCINCQRTFPYLNQWYKEYESKGLIIIGIHTPEFAFEHDIGNVTKAMAQFGITFPVVLDNNYGTWTAYGNEYWPHQYLIDIDGYIPYDHIGEGGDAQTENAIVKALDERAERVSAPPVTAIDAPVVADTSSNSILNPQSPESYLGSDRSQYDTSIVGACTTSTVCSYTQPPTIPRDHFAFSGTWNQQPQYMQLTSTTGSIIYHFNAKEVHLVAQADTNVHAEIYLDGKPIDAAAAGPDVSNGIATFNDARLYTLVKLPGPEEHTLEIKVTNSGLQAYAFTFS